MLWSLTPKNGGATRHLHAFHLANVTFMDVMAVAR
jgi:hypothetical protein